jgi:WD40 repeat protein
VLFIRATDSLVIAPSTSHIISSLPSPSNILAVHVTPSRTPWTTHQDAATPSQLLVSSADRKISVLHTDAEHELQKTLDLCLTHNSPVLSITSIADDAFITSSMSGHVDLYKPDHGFVDSQRHHDKYAVQVIITQSRYDTRRGKPFCLAASAGWDQKICIYSFEPPFDAPISDGDTQYNHSQIGSAVAIIKVPTNPESVLFVRHPDSGDLYLIVGRRDSTYLYYYGITEELDAGPVLHPIITIKEAGRQNLAPYANAWISFSPASVAACPIDATLIAVATSHLPHMKLILVRLLFPGFQGHRGTAGFVVGGTQASQAGAELAVQDREDAAILLHVSTMSPQTPYSTPQVVWRPDGSGMWVNGDDGVVRGIEAKTGKIVAGLRGHEVGSKVRTLWAGMVSLQRAGGGESIEEEEWLVSGGFDKKVIVWKAEDRSVNM